MKVCRARKPINLDDDRRTIWATTKFNEWICLHCEKERWGEMLYRICYRCLLRADHKR